MRQTERGKKGLTRTLTVEQAKEAVKEFREEMRALTRRGLIGLKEGKGTARWVDNLPSSYGWGAEADVIEMDWEVDSTGKLTFGKPKIVDGGANTSGDCGRQWEGKPRIRPVKDLVATMDARDAAYIRHLARTVRNLED